LWSHSCHQTEATDSTQRATNEGRAWRGGKSRSEQLINGGTSAGQSARCTELRMVLLYLALLLMLLLAFVVLLQSGSRPQMKGNGQ
jgi:hypothetical protein